MSSPRTSTYVAAALQVLQAEKEPLTSREIADKAIALGLIRPLGKTTERTMASELYVYAQRFPNGSIKKISETGPSRARRGTVKWTLHE